MSGPPVVGYVTRMFPQTSETFIANEILHLEQLGLPVRIFSYRRPRARVTHECVRQIRAPVTYLPDPLYRSPRKLLRTQLSCWRMNPDRYERTVRYVAAHTLRTRNPHTWFRFAQAVHLAAALAESDIQHLHAHFAHGSTRVAQLTSMLTGIPFSFTAHARDVFSYDVNVELLREKVKQARFVVTVSEFNRAYLNDLLGLENGHIRTIYNGVDLEKFAPGPEDEREGDLVLAVGRLVEKKGFEHLVEACSLLRSEGRRFRCEIVGEGELRERLAAKITEAGLEDSVRLVGPRSQEELAPYFRRASLLVMPAVLGRDGNRDALPTVLLEAIACGIPVIGSRLTGIPEIVDHGENGLLIEPGDVAGLASAIATLLDDSELRRRYGRAARHKAERRFDVETNVGQLYELLTTRVHAPRDRELNEIRVPVM